VLVGTLSVNLKALTAGFGRDMKAAAQAMQQVGSEMRDLAGTAAMATAAIGGVAVASLKMASDFNETSNVLTTAFGESAPAIEAWAKDTAEAMGRSTQQMREFVGVSQSMLFGMTGNRVAAMEMSKGLTQLAVDMGSFFNVADKDAFDALKSAITGEAEPMKRFGVVMLESTLQAYALSKGITKKMDAMSEAEKVALRYNFIMERTALAQGDAVKTADSLGNRFKALVGFSHDLGVSFGNELEPTAKAVLAPLIDLVQWLKKADGPTLQLAARATSVALAGAAVATALFSVGAAVAGVVAIMPAIIAGFGTMLTTILPIVVIAGTLIVLLSVIADNWEALSAMMKDAASDVVSSMRSAFSSIGSFLAGVFSGLADILAATLMLPVRAIVHAEDMMRRATLRILDELEPLIEFLGLTEKFKGVRAWAVRGAAASGFDVKQLDAWEKALADSPRAMLNNVTEYWSSGGEGYQTIHGAMLLAGDTLEESVGTALRSAASGFPKMLAALFGIDLNAARADTTAKAGPNQRDHGSASPAGKDEKEKEPREPRSVGEWLEAQGRLAENHGTLIDTIIGGGLFDPVAMGAALGTAAGGPIGAQVGGAVGDAIMSLVDILSDALSGFADAVVEGVRGLSDAFVAPFLQSRGAQQLGDAAGAGLGVAGAIAAVTAAFVGLVVAVHVVGPILANLFGPALAIAAGAAALLTVAFFPLIAAVGLAAAEQLAYVGALGLAAAGAAAFLSMATQTKSYERFNSAVSQVVQNLIGAFEPFFTGLLPLVSLFEVLLMPLQAMLGGLFNSDAAFRMIYAGAQSLTLGLISVAEAMQGFAVGILTFVNDLTGGLVPQIVDALAAARAWDPILAAARDAASRSYDEAAVHAGGLADAFEELGASASSLNVPTGYYTERRRGDVAGGDMQAILDALADRGSSTTTVVIEHLQVRSAEDFFELIERIGERRNSNARGVALSNLLRGPASRRR
jgi:hypothetical protein